MTVDIEHPVNAVNIDVLPLVTYVAPLDAAWTVEYVSPQIETLLGFPAHDWVSEPDFWLGRVAPEDREHFLDVWTAVRTTREPVTVEYRMIARDGTCVWVRDAATVSSDENGVATVQGFLTDVTREKELGLELARERALTDAFFRDSPAGMTITDTAGRFVRVNEALARMNGIPVEAHVGKRLREINPVVDADVEPLLAEVRRTGIPLQNRRVSTELASGTTVTSLVSYFRVEAAGSTNYGGVVIDTTELDRAREERAEAEREYRRLIEQLPLVTYVNRYDVAGDEWRTAYVSPQIEQLFGLPPEAWLADHTLWDSLVHPDDLARVLDDERTIRETGASIEFEYRIVRPDGSIRWVLDMMHVVRDASGPPFEQGFVIDITPRKRAEQAERDAVAALRSSEELFRAVFDNALDAMAIADDDGRYVDVNPAACELFGLDRETLLTMTVDDVSCRSPGYTGQVWVDFLAAGRASGPFTLVRPDESVRDAEFSATANVLPGRHLSVLHDVTERRQLEQRLLQAQKLDSVGTLAGGVAHDFNNMLMAIGGYSQLLLSRLEPDSLESGHAEEIARAAGRAAKLTAQLLAFGRRQVLQPQDVDLNALVSEMSSILSHQVGDDVELEIALAQDLRPVSADPGQVEQAILNLVGNAAEAVAGNGRITIRTRNLVIDEHASTELAPGAYVELSVGDSGRGMDPDLLERVFEPFFTTKEVGLGEGLGLSTAYGIAKQSGGTMTAESTAGVGSTFAIQLPAAG